MELIFSYHIAQYFCQKHSFPKGKSEKKKTQNQCVWSLKYSRSVVNSLHQIPKLIHKAGCEFPFQSRKYIHHFSVQLITQHKHFK